MAQEEISEAAREFALEAWRQPETRYMVMDEKLCMAFARIVDVWIETARFHARNEAFYRGLIDQCAQQLGQAAYTADDGTVREDPVRLKVPELVAQLVLDYKDLTRHG